MLPLDRVQRHYAHTAWTHNDPLAGLDDHERRAILLRPSTFRERLYLSPFLWNQAQRREALQHIIAERRLAYDLQYESFARQRMQAGTTTALTSKDQPLSPYYRHRLQLHQQAEAAVTAQRQRQDTQDLRHDPRAQADHRRRLEIRKRMAELEFERSRLELEVFDLDVAKTPAAIEHEAEPEYEHDEGR